MYRILKFINGDSEYKLSSLEKVLETINRTGKTQYKGLSSIKISVSTLNARFLRLMNLGFVKHFAMRDAKERKEWYEIAEKEKIVLEILEQLAHKRDKH